MRNLSDDAVEGQAAPPTDNSPKRKVGVEIVISAPLSSRHFRGPSPRRKFPTWYENDWGRMLEASAL